MNMGMKGNEYGGVMSCGQWVCMRKYGDRIGGQALHDSMHVYEQIWNHSQGLWGRYH